MWNTFFAVALAAGLGELRQRTPAAAEIVGGGARHRRSIRLAARLKPAAGLPSPLVIPN